MNLFVFMLITLNVRVQCTSSSFMIAVDYR
jgi:hypothetical protein